MNNTASIVEACRSYFGEGWAAVLERLIANAPLQPRQAYASTAQLLRGTLRVQERTTAQAGIEAWGFAELLQRLNELADAEAVNVEEFDVGDFVVRCAFRSSTYKLIGCTIVKRRLKQLQTPPGWDGSIESLERFNQPEEG